MKKIIIPLVIMIAILYYINFIRFEPVINLSTDSFALKDNKISENLINENKKNIKSTKLTKNETLYKQNNNYFVGVANKKNINSEIPFVSKDNTQLYILSDTFTLINSLFQKNKSYKNVILAQGKSYNLFTLNQNEDDLYYFINISSGPFINLFSLKVYSNNKTYEIKENSFLIFDTDQIRYYSRNNGVYVYHEINGLDDDSKIAFNGKTFTYKDFKILLDIEVKSDEKEETIEKLNKEIVEENVVNKAEEKNEDNIQKFVIPQVNAKNFEANIYSISSSISISDPSFRIKQNPTFEIKKNGKIFLRKSVGMTGAFEIDGLLPDTEYEIEGYFTYINNKNQQIKRTFFSQKIKTKDISSLEELELSIENNKFYPNNISTNLKILNQKNDEVLKGIKEVIFNVGDKKYSFSSSQIQSLKNLETVTYSTAKNLESNSNYTVNIQIKDLAGNTLKIKNDSFETKTSKEPPTAKITDLQTDIFKASFNVKIDNKDNVPLTNTKYIVYNNDGSIIKQENFDMSKKVEITDLDQNSVYNVVIYGDYDLENGDGINKEQKLEEIKFSTKPISTLGYIRLKYEDENLSQDSVSYNLSLNKDLTASQLIELLNKVNIKIIDSNTDETVINKSLSKEEIIELQSSNAVQLNFLNLNSQTNYKVETTASVKQGTKEYDIKVQTNLTEFKTLKKDAEVIIKNKFTNENIIDFDVKIADDDNAIESDIVYMEVRNEQGNLVHIEELKINDDYKRITLDKLEKENNYTFTYIATSYNVGYTNKTFEDNKVLYKETLRTDVGIKGTIELDNLLKDIQSKNIFDINDNSKWRTNGTPLDIEYNIKKNTIELSAKNSDAAYYYYIPEYKNRKIIVSFSARYKDGSNTTNAYIGKGYGGASQNKLDGISNEYKQYNFVFDVGTSPYFGFHINGAAGQNLITTIDIKNLQVRDITDTPDVTYLDKYDEYKEGDKLNSTLIANIDDSQNQLDENKFYIQVVKNGEIIKTDEYDMKGSHQSLNHYLNYKLEKEKNYTFNLCVKIRERYYEISTVSFNTKSEIRSIKTADDLYNIHDKGNYIVSNDLDIRDRGLNNINFRGTIDFQGHKVLRDMKNGTALFNGILQTAVLKNIDLHIYITQEIHNRAGLVLNNGGTIENIKVTLEECTSYPHERVGLIGLTNDGTLKNFVINSKVSLNTSGKTGLAFYTNGNKGIIEYGYAYGEPINATYENSTTDDKSVGAIVGNSLIRGSIKNVYSLVNILMPENITTASEYAVGNISGVTNGQNNISNVYSYVGDVGRNLNIDPNLGKTGTNMNIKNVFYVSDNIYITKLSNKISKIALKNVKFQNKMLNTEGNFIVDDLINYGYYPQLKWPECMPIQDYIPLPTIEDDDLIDIISVDDVKQNGSKATAVLTINNPGGEEITDISLKNIDSKIIDQTNADGETSLTIELSNPTKYLSQYYVRSITSVGSFGISYTRKYEDYERALDIDMYREINNINDWKNVKQHLDENYILETDLDFQGTDNISISNFAGKFNGNNHTIRNITIENSSLFSGTLSGDIVNLYVENYTEKNNTKDYGGLISYASNASIDNVHLKNISIGSTNQYLGGLIGLAQYSQISNCSVTGVNINNKIKQSTYARIGGLIGYADKCIIYNVYTNDVDFSIDGTSSYTGGIFGYLYNSSLNNSYSIGQINVLSKNIGGITGGSGASYLFNVYSKVDITNRLDYNGGIVGNDTDNSNKVVNSLSLGDIYTWDKEINNIGRTVGNVEATTTNYAWSEQRINGVTETKTGGETLLTTEQLNNSETYTDIIEFGDNFDYSNVKNNILPLLYYSNKKELLPNQKYTELENEELFNILNTNISSGASSATISLDIDNPNNYSIKGVEIDGLKVNKITKNINQDGITYLTIEVSPEKAYDNYKLDKVIYTDNGKEKEYGKAVRIDLTFYKDLSSFEDWQKISTTDPENYRLINDIDFSGKKNINTNVVFNRLEGLGQTYSLKNIDFEFTKETNALIERVDSNISNVNFENINATYSESGYNEYTGIIRYLYGDMSNVNFSHVKMGSTYNNYVGCISYAIGSSLKNITLNDINIKANYCAGGLISKTTQTEKSNISLSDVTVTGGEYLGGLVGNDEGEVSPKDFYISGDNLTIVSKDSHVGGLYGIGGGQYLSVTNSYVEGNSYVGGLYGSSNTQNTSDLSVSHTVIKGSGSYIGGISGNIQSSGRAYVDDCQIYGTSETSSQVGGIAGTGQWNHWQYKVVNSLIDNKGTYTGGIIGNIVDENVSQAIVYNTNIIGAKYVGGAYGSDNSYYNGGVDSTIINANITATNSTAGGVFGYERNKSTTSAQGVHKVNNVMLLNTSVTSPDNTGGLVGMAEKNLTSSYFSGNYFDINVNSTNEDGNSGILVGNGDEYASEVNKALFYENSTVNNTKLKDMNITFPNDNERLVNLSELKEKSTYTSVGLNFDFTPLSKNLYPQLNYTDLRYDIPLPTEINSVETLSKAPRMVRNAKIEPFPTVYVYPSDVDKINIEFSKIMPSATFTINGETLPITQKTYTFEYNFVDDIDITINNGISKKEINKKAKDLIQTSTVIGEKYYIIDDNKIKTNDKEIKGNFINLYKDKALMSNGDIYDLNVREEIATSINNLKEVDEIPLYESNYENYNIKTYLTYSVVDGKTINNQLFVKNGQLEIIDSTLNNKKNMINIDEYNDESYIIVLNEDGTLETLKDTVNYPQNFKNRNIKSITSNIEPSSNLIVVTYQDGDYICFDYHTGKVYAEKEENKENLLSFYKAKVNEIGTNNVETEKAESLAEAEDLVEKLENKSVEEVLTNDQSDNKNVYQTVYSESRKQYVVYDVNDLLQSGDYQEINNEDSSNEDNQKEESVTETPIVNDQIENNITLSNYYSEKNKEINWIAIFIVLLLSIIVSLIILFKILKKNKNLKVANS